MADRINFNPLHDKVLVQRLDETQAASGAAGLIIIPDTAKEKSQIGVVIAAGLGKRNEDGTRQQLDVQVGARIVFGKYAGSEIKLDGEEFLIMREDEILGHFIEQQPERRARR